MGGDPLPLPPDPGVLMNINLLLSSPITLETLKLSRKRHGDEGSSTLSQRLINNY